MNITQIIKRAWNILWSYKTLWIFGILFALVGGSALPRGGGNGVNYRVGSQDFRPNNGSGINIPPEVQQEFQRFGQQISHLFSPEMWPMLLTWIIVLSCLALILTIVSITVKNVTRTAMIRMVDRYEASGEKVRFREGWRMGWSRAAFRIFLINLLVYVPVFVVVVGLFGCAALPVITSVLANNQPGAFSIISTIGLVFVAIFVILIISLILAMLMEPVYRECALGNKGVIESIRGGWDLVRKNLKDVFLLWLLLVGIYIGFAIVSFIVVLMFLMLGLVLGGGAGVGLYFLLQASAGMVAAIIWGAVVGGILFILVLSLPMLFLSGLYQTFISSTWTLAYRELTQPKLPAEPAPVTPEPAV